MHFELIEVVSGETVIVGKVKTSLTIGRLKIELTPPIASIGEYIHQRHHDADALSKRSLLPQKFSFSYAPERQFFCY